MSRRKKPTELGHNALVEFLREAEAFHHFVIRTKTRARVGSPHNEALDKLAEELRIAYCAVSGEEAVPWSRESSTLHVPRPWEAD